jgi:hypothetical protein
MLLSGLKYILIVASIAAVGFGGYWYFSQERKREMNPVMEELSKRTTKDFSSQIPRVQNVERLLVIAKIGGRDEDSHLEQTLVNSIANKRKYTVQTWREIQEKLDAGTLWQQFMDQMGWIDGQMPTTLEETQAAVKVLNTANIKIDGVFIIDCLYQEEEDSVGSKVALEGQIYKVNKRTSKLTKAGKHVEASNSIETHWDRLYLTYEVQSYSFFTRFLIWCLFSFAPFWVFIPTTRWVIKKKDNTWLGVYIGLSIFSGTFLFWFILAALASINFGTVVFLIIVASAIYKINYDALDYIARKLM